MLHQFVGVWRCESPVCRHRPRICVGYATTQHSRWPVCFDTERVNTENCLIKCDDSSWGHHINHRALGSLQNPETCRFGRPAAVTLTQYSPNWQLLISFISFRGNVLGRQYSARIRAQACRRRCARLLRRCFLFVSPPGRSPPSISQSAVAARTIHPHRRPLRRTRVYSARPARRYEIASAAPAADTDRSRLRTQPARRVTVSCPPGRRLPSPDDGGLVCGP